MSLQQTTMDRMAKAAKNARGEDRHAPNRMIRIPVQLYLELQALAKENERPVHWEARIALRRHIAEEKRRRQQTATD
jgi:hypothetical protein